MRVEVSDIEFQTVFGKWDTCVRVIAGTLSIFGETCRTVQAQLKVCEVLGRALAYWTRMMQWRVSFVEEVGMLHDVGSIGIQT